jgi:putative flavoprotein involved in K+ transport
MPCERIETLVVGGGQAGLTMSDMLRRRGLQHIVVEQHRIAERWRAERWDGLRFQFPNWSINLPNFAFNQDDPEGFPTAVEIADYLTAYAEFIRAPIRCGIKVNVLRQKCGSPSFVAETSAGLVEATNVVVATGPYQRPIIPPLLSEDCSIFQVHAGAYKRPDQLPAGGVLIVGSGASGTQIAEELHRAGRHVYLSVGRHRRFPRRYRGHDLIWWLCELGIDQTPSERRGPDKALPLITGAYGGHTIDFRVLAGQGIILLGHVVSSRGRILDIAPDIGANLAAGDEAYAEFLEKVDAHVREHGMTLPAEPAARVVPLVPECVGNPIRKLDLDAAGISSIIWATGYGFDFSWLDLPVLNDDGEPRHRGGVSEIAGLYFLGLPWLSKMTSSFLSGVADDAAWLAEQIANSRSNIP